MMIALLLLWCLISAGDSASSHNLTFMLVTSYGQYGFNSSGAVPAADMALEDINRDPDILMGYNLMYDKVRDSMVHHNLATIMFSYSVSVNFQHASPR